MLLRKPHLLRHKNIQLKGERKIKKKRKKKERKYIPKNENWLDEKAGRLGCYKKEASTRRTNTPTLLAF